MTRKIIYTLILFLLVGNIYADKTIKGIIKDKNGEVLDGVLVKINKTTIATTTFYGQFELSVPDSISVIILSCSLIGYKNQSVYLPKDQDYVDIILKENSEQLQEVVVSSSKYSRMSNYNGQVTKLNAFEVYTNPQALGNIIGGLKILPSVQMSETDGRLIIQGGDTDESQVFVDGLLIYNPYTLSQKNIGVRSRFSPDLFKGISLFSGGYSADYGQAISGILELNTIDKEDLLPKIDINVSSTGVEGAIIKNNKNHAYRINGAYTDMTPYGKLITDSYNWHRYYNQINGDVFLYNNFSKSTTLKTKLYYSKSSVDYSYNNNDSTSLRNDLSENYLMVSSVLNHVTKKHNIYVGVNIISDKFTGTDVNLANDSVETKNIYSHIKVYDTYTLNENANIVLGADNIYNKFDESYYYREEYKLNYNNNITSVFGALSFTKEKFSISLNVKGEHYSYIKAYKLSPRFYASYRSSQAHTFTFSSGIYYQNPSSDYLKFTRDIDPQKSINTNITYSYIKKLSKLSLDIYYKDYKNLITYDQPSFYLTNISNKGNGYVYGLNTFWKHNIRNFEYWLSYSYLKSNILNKDFSYRRQPVHISPHTFRMTTKYWISDIKSMIGLSCYIDSGAKYTNPSDQSVQKNTPYRAKLDFSWSYLPAKGIIVHLGCQNILGRENVYGYNYSFDNMSFKSISTPDPRFFYLGVFITLSKMSLNQLKSL